MIIIFIYNAWSRNKNYYSLYFLNVQRCKSAAKQSNVSGYDCPNAILVCTIRNQELCRDISARGANQLNVHKRRFIILSVIIRVI